MLDFQVEGMNCAHCEAAVTHAVHNLDPAARVTVERAADRVMVDSAADPGAMRLAIEAEGYVVKWRVRSSAAPEETRI